MFVATPLIVDQYIRSISYETEISLSRLREDLAIQHNAGKTSPTSTEIFLRIVSEAAHEGFQQGTNIENTTPFWRVINEENPTAKKKTFGTKLLRNQRTKEGLR